MIKRSYDENINDSYLLFYIAADFDNKSVYLTYYKSFDEAEKALNKLKRKFPNKRNKRFNYVKNRYQDLKAYRIVGLRFGDTLYYDDEI